MSKATFSVCIIPVLIKKSICKPHDKLLMHAGDEQDVTAEEDSENDGHVEIKCGVKEF